MFQPGGAAWGESQRMGTAGNLEKGQFEGLEKV